jgi:N-methylhydantoinase A
MKVEEAAAGVSEVVNESMCSAARAHAIEQGIPIHDCTLVAFGGAAPLHAARVAQKLGITKMIVPMNAGIGSAIGFLHAPIAYSVVRIR